MPEEYEHFLRLIEGKTIIIGRRSVRDLRRRSEQRPQRRGQPIRRRHARRGRRPDHRGRPATAASFGGTFFSAGGATIYAQTIPLADTMYLSYIKGHFTGDTYFPRFPEEEWTVERRDDHPRFEFVVYRRLHDSSDPGGDGGGTGGDPPVAQDGGVLQLIVRRPEVDAREVLEEGRLDVAEGLVGDTLESSRSRGAPNPDMQLNIMNARAIALIARSTDRWPLAGDQLFIDLDLSEDNLPAGTRLALGSAIIEITAPPHTGCGKFASRFGVDAVKFVNSSLGKRLRLRGINAKVVQSGRFGPAIWFRRPPRDRAAATEPAMTSDPRLARSTSISSIRS